MCVACVGHLHALEWGLYVHRAFFPITAECMKSTGCKKQNSFTIPHVPASHYLRKTQHGPGFDPQPAEHSGTRECLLFIPNLGIHWVTHSQPSGGHSLGLCYEHLFTVKRAANSWNCCMEFHIGPLWTIVNTHTHASTPCLGSSGSGLVLNVVKLSITSSLTV